MMPGFIMRHSATKDDGVDPYLLSLGLMEMDRDASRSASEPSNDQDSAANGPAQRGSLAVVESVKPATAKKGQDSKSRPPSPPESGTTTPRVTIAPCPSRLTMTVPPPNYGAVDVGMVYRSSFPQDRNIDFVKPMHIRSVLTLVDTEPSAGYAYWIMDSKIKQRHIHIATNKDGNVNTTIESLCEALIFIMDSSNHPIWIHCNQGKHRTGCVVACLRKVQRMPLEKALKEYIEYASPKERPGDIQLIKNFDPECVLEYAKTHGYLGGAHPRLKRLDSGITNVDDLAAALAAGALSEPEAESADCEPTPYSSRSSSTSDDALEMALCSGDKRAKFNDEPTLPAHSHDVVVQSQSDSSGVTQMEVSVAEVDEDVVMAVDGEVEEENHLA